MKSIKEVKFPKPSLEMKYRSYLCGKCTKKPPLCYNCNKNKVDPNSTDCFNCFPCTPNLIICTKCSEPIGNDHSWAYLCKECTKFKDNCAKCKVKMQ